jgi:hypothetical protein
MLRVIFLSVIELIRHSDEYPFAVFKSLGQK